MKKKMKIKKFKTIKDYLETCSEDEKEFIYDIYFDMSVDDLVEIIFGNLPPDDVIQEIEEYREEMEWDDNEAEKSNKSKRKCDCDFVGCQGC
jgi:hypothetical protein